MDESPRLKWLMLLPLQSLHLLALLLPYISPFFSDSESECVCSREMCCPFFCLSPFQPHPQSEPLSLSLCVALALCPASHQSWPFCLLLSFARHLTSLLSLHFSLLHLHLPCHPVLLWLALFFFCSFFWAHWLWSSLSFSHTHTLHAYTCPRSHLPTAIYSDQFTYSHARTNTHVVLLCFVPTVPICQFACSIAGSCLSSLPNKERATSLTGPAAAAAVISISQPIICRSDLRVCRRRRRSCSRRHVAILATGQEVAKFACLPACQRNTPADVLSAMKAIFW